MLARTQYFTRMLEAVAEANKIDLDKPWSKLTKAQQNVMLFGAKGQVTVKYKNRYGRQRQYNTTLRRHHPVPAAAPQRRRVRLEPRADRGLHARGAVPGVRRRTG